MLIRATMVEKVVQADSDHCSILPSGDPNSNDYPQRTCEWHCGNCDYYKAVVVNYKGNLNWNREFVFCVPKETSNRLRLPVGELKSASMLPTEYNNPSNVV